MKGLTFARPSTCRAPHRQRGAGLLEVMVGVVIGLIVVLVVYNILAISEGYRRVAMGVSDAQVTGQIAQFVLTREIANAGNGLSSALDEFTACTAPLGPAGAVAGWHRPIPVLITDGGAVSDSLIVYYSTSPRLVSAAITIEGPFPTGTALKAQSPNGFVQNDLIIAIDGANCALGKLDVAPTLDATTGAVTLTPVPATGVAFSDQTKILNLGQNGGVAGIGGARRVNFDVFPVPNLAAPTFGQLRSTDLLTLPGPNAPNPIAPNIFRMKAQYGIDTSVPADGVVDFWTSADNSSGVDYSAAAVTGFNAAALSRIKAVRIGVVVHSDEYDVNQPAQTTYLFNCAMDTTAACQGRVQVALPANYRFRSYETVIPLRNAIWNAMP